MVKVTPMNGEKAPVPAAVHSDEGEDDDDTEDLGDIPLVDDEEDGEVGRASQSPVPKRPLGVPILNIAAAVQVQARAIETDETNSDERSSEGEDNVADRKGKGQEESGHVSGEEGAEASQAAQVDQTKSDDISDGIGQGGLRHRGQKNTSETTSSQDAKDESAAADERTLAVQRAAALVAARRQATFGRPSFTTIMIGFIALYIAFSFVQLYFVFLPKSCSGAEQRCLKPLFPPDQKVDIYVFSSKSPDFPSKGSPFWNATGVSVAEGVTARAIVPLPPGVRSNGSLFAHISVVKTGLSPFPKDHLPQGHKRSHKKQVYPYEGILTMSTPLTRYMSRMHSNHSMLVSTSSSSSSSSSSSASASLSAASSPDAARLGPSPTEALAAQGSSGGDTANTNAGDENLNNDTASTHKVAVDDKQIPQLIAVLMLAFALSGIFAPSLPLAALRHLLLLLLAYLLQPFLSPYLSSFSSSPSPSSSLATSPSAAASSSPAAVNASLKEVFFTEREIITHWKPLLRLRYVTDTHEYPDNELPMSHIAWDHRHQNMLPKHYQIYNQAHERGLWKYVPVAFVDDFGMQARHFVPLSPDKKLPDPSVVIQFEPLSLSRFQVLKFLEGSFEMMKGAGLHERDLDDIKDLVSDRSLKVLGITYLITFLHVTFDFLAFKNDIGFFRGRETYEGLSSRSLLSSFVCSLIIFLYLLDNDFTSRIVLASTAISTLIEGWKAKRVSKASVQWHFLLPWVSTRRGGLHGEPQTAAEKLTEDIDALGMKWLGRALYPLVGLWALYSLVTRPHKSWWSWAIHSLAHAVYTFGFIGMTPQLFVNYKLKSVAHLPWKPFMYKAFNTFIDDVFSWVIAMPMSHRIACLRDDVVFFVYLYQRWLYPVDKTRPNEFGMAYEVAEEEEAAAAAIANASAGAERAAESKKDA